MQPPYGPQPGSPPYTAGPGWQPPYQPVPPMPPVRLRVPAQRALFFTGAALGIASTLIYLCFSMLYLFLGVVFLLVNQAGNTLLLFAIFWIPPLTQGVASGMGLYVGAVCPKKYCRGIGNTLVVLYAVSFGLLLVVTGLVVDMMDWQFAMDMVMLVLYVLPAFLALVLCLIGRLLLPRREEYGPPPLPVAYNAAPYYSLPPH